MEVQHRHSHQFRFPFHPINEIFISQIKKERRKMYYKQTKRKKNLPKVLVFLQVNFQESY